jgi:hypothetical protein
MKSLSNFAKQIFENWSLENQQFMTFDDLNKIAIDTKQKHAETLRSVSDEFIQQIQEYIDTNDKTRSASILDKIESDIELKSVVDSHNNMIRTVFRGISAPIDMSLFDILAKEQKTAYVSCTDDYETAITYAKSDSNNRPIVLSYDTAYPHSIMLDFSIFKGRLNEPFQSEIVISPINSKLTKIEEI